MRPFTRTTSHPVVAVLALALGFLVLVSAGAISVVNASHPTAPGPEADASAASTGVGYDARGPPASAQEIAPLSASQELGFVVGLAPTGGSALANYAAGVQDPSSPDYDKYLTPSEFEVRFSPTVGVAETVEAYFVEHGATDLSLTSDRMSLSFVLPAGDVPSTFGTSLAFYTEAGGQVVYAPEGHPELPSPIAADLSGVEGLTNAGSHSLSTFLTEESSFRVAEGSEGVAEYDNLDPGPGQVFWGTDYQGVYDELPLLNDGDNGAGWSVATILWSGFNETLDENLPPWDPTALDQYYSDTFPSGAALPVPNAEPVTVDGVTPPQPGSINPPPPLGTGPNDDVSGQLENSLDLEMIGSTAPGANIYCFYIAGSVVASDFTDLYGDFDQAVSQALGLTYPGDGLAAISNSYGLQDANDSSWVAVEEQAEVEHVTLVASSGDAGNAPKSLTDRPQGQWPSWPASEAFQSYGVTSVGGTTVTVTGTGGTWSNQNDLPPMSYDATSITGVSTQVGWYDNESTAGLVAGSEGGISFKVPEPLWQAQSAAQSALSFASTREGLSTIGRGEPDISYAGNDTIVFLSSVGGITGAEVAGTSIASPLFAGFLTVIAQADGKASGYLDPALYSMGGYFETQAPGSPQDPFHGEFAITSSTSANWVFNASVGWNAFTGWGTPDVALLQLDLQNSQFTSFVYNPSATPGSDPYTHPATSPASSNLLTLVLLALVLCVVLIVILAVVLSRRHARARASGQVAPQAYPPQTPYGSPLGGGPGYGAGPYGGYGGYGGPSPPPVVYSSPGAYGAPPPTAPYPPPPPTLSFAVAPPGAGIVLPASPYAPVAPPPPPSPAANYCRYCRNPRPANAQPCIICGAPP